MICSIVRLFRFPVQCVRISSTIVLNSYWCKLSLKTELWRKCSITKWNIPVDLFFQRESNLIFFLISKQNLKKITVISDFYFINLKKNNYFWYLCFKSWFLIHKSEYNSYFWFIKVSNKISRWLLLKHHQ